MRLRSSTITYVPMRCGFMKLTAIGYCSRYLPSWLLTNTLERRFSPEVFDEDLSRSCRTCQFQGSTIPRHRGVLWSISL